MRKVIDGIAIAAGAGVIAILGGGNAGMTLAAELSLSNVDKKIIIFEPHSPKVKSATWSTWANDSDALKLKPHLKGVWKRWKIVGNQSEVVHESSEFNYIAVDATKYLEVECDIAPYREGKKDKIGFQQFVDIGKLIIPE